MTRESARRRMLNELKEGNDWRPENIKKILIKLETSKIIEEPAADWKDLVFWASRACLVRVKDVMGKGRNDEHCMARNIVCHTLYVYWGWTQIEIAALFNKHRTTILSGIKRIEGDIFSKHPPVVEAMDRFTGYIGKYEIK